jgi:tetratricopeptide (TPR) repeat protein/DNA-directed RNA polymerase subunit RPC12/RpoP
MANQYFCAHCDEAFTLERSSDDPRCPKCMRRGVVEPVNRDEAPRDPMRRWMVIPSILLAVAGIGYWLYSQSSVSLEATPPVRPLEPRELSAYLERDQIEAGGYASMFMLPSRVDGFPKELEAIADAINSRSSRWSLEQALRREVLTADATLAALGDDTQRQRYYPLELAVALTSLLRQHGVEAMVAEVAEFAGEEAPADPSGMLGYFVTAVYEGGSEEPSKYLDPWGGQTGAPVSAPRVLRDTEAIGAALGIESARVFSKSGDAGEALPMIETALRLDPVSPALRVVHATVLIESGGLPQALQELEAAVQLRPDAPRKLSKVQLSLAQAGLLRASGDTANAKAQLDEAHRLVTDIIEEWPRYGRAHLTMATIYLGLGENGRARFELETAQSLSADSPAVWAVWAQYHLATDDPIAAARKMGQAIELDPDNWQLRVQAVGVYRAAGDEDRARANADKALELIAPKRRNQLRDYLERLMGSGTLAGDAPKAATGAGDLELPDPTLGVSSETSQKEAGPALMLGDPSNLRLRDPDEELKLDLDD